MPKKKNKMVLDTSILETKQELVHALDSGAIKVSKYNTLSDEEKEFVKLIAFGNYKPYQAIKQVAPHIKDHYAAGKSWSMRDNVRDVLEELTYKSDVHWMTQLDSARDLGLRTMIHLMNSTKDEALKAALARDIVKISSDGLKKPVEENTSQGINLTLTLAKNPGNGDDVIDVEEVEEFEYGKAIDNNYKKEG